MNKNLVSHRVPNFNLIDSLKSVLRDYGITLDFYIDRVRIYCDARTNSNDLLELVRTQQTYNTVITQRLTRHHRIDRCIELLQPDAEKLQTLRQVIKGDHLLNYAEFALDFYAEEEEVLGAWRGCLQKLLVHERTFKNNKGAFPITIHEGTHYYQAKKRDSIEIVLYSDRPKRYDKLPVHVEVRLRGLQSLRKAGLSVLDDLIYFNDHPREFWTTRLDLRMPKWEQLGKMLPGKAITSQGYIKRAANFMMNLDSLQSHFNNEPDHAEAFKPIPTEKALKDLIARYMSDK